MQRFPDSIIRSMLQSGAMTTCVPIEFDDGVWESAVFFELSGKQCNFDRLILTKTKSPLGINLEAESIAHANASVVMLRFEILTQPDDPLAGEVLIVPGLGDVQFETLKLLSHQRNLKFYFSDDQFNVIHSQQLVLTDQERQGYGQILEEVISHDALVRLTGKYDAMAALSEVVNHYEVRSS